MRRCLFGPASATFAADDLKPFNSILWDFQGKHSLTLASNTSWNDVLRQLSDGWRPDVLILSLPYTSIPLDLFNAPVPIVGLAPDWNLLWSCYRHILPRCDQVLTDQSGVDRLTRAGFTHIRPANLFGLEKAALAGITSLPDIDRDIDVLFVGNCQPAVQRERVAWLGRLAKLSRKFNVVIRDNVRGLEYWKLLKRAKIVFNRSIRGECNQRVFEAIAARAMLLQEDENAEVAAILNE